jgi:hypothetical protein
MVFRLLNWPLWQPMAGLNSEPQNHEGWYRCALSFEVIKIDRSTPRFSREGSRWVKFLPSIFDLPKILLIPLRFSLSDVLLYALCFFARNS